MPHQISIKFYRTARNAKKLTGIVEEFSCYELANDYTDPCYIYISKDSYPEDLRGFVYFWDIVKKSKTSAMYADDMMLTDDQVNGILNWFNCYCNRELFDNQADYCFIVPGAKHMHGWGCKWLHSVLRHSKFGKHAGIHWYNVGPFDGKIQYIDKQAIKDKLEDEAALKCLNLCPMFSLEKAFQYVNLLPDQIDPTVDTKWEYEASEEPESKLELVGVKPKPTGILDLLQ